MKILVDADACPRTVLQICLELGHQYGIPVWTVASFNHQIESDHHVIVGNAPQEADIKVMNLAEAEDIVITQDWGLAAMILAKGAQCLSPTGRIFCSETMDFLLEERDIKARVRRSGGRTKGPRKRTARDDRRFKHRLQQVIEARV